jgi:FkbM family methyltransferase
MYRLARSPIAPILGQHVPARGPARLLHRSYAKASRHPGRDVRQLTTRNGDAFEADLSSFLEWQLWAFGGHEEHLAELFRLLVRPGDRCLDIGANVGVHTVRLAKLAGPDAEVIAVEADPELARRTVANLARNQVGHVRVINAAVSDQNDRRVVLGSRDISRGRAGAPHPHLTGTRSTVPTVTLDEIAAGPVALIRIDAGGCEAAVVAGAARTIAASRPSIVFRYTSELLDQHGLDPWSFLIGQGYQILQIWPGRPRVTGRSRMVLEQLRMLPPPRGDLLAIAPELMPRLGTGPDL